MIETMLINRVRQAMIAPMWRKTALGVLMSGMVALTGCVTINAPTKPIQIDLNINISQEVVYKLDKDAKSLIKDNPGIF
ncbi:hypothetical protein GCM10023219_08890 [Stakelama sediminis]|uniref:YnbE-like lipoprotein n=1 Tax=Stakelama sediminis TaxID=463200 RepID=A0A840YV93_9SPHN|nr:YnbE family lipoprotein [Stakelama sediminis]MBB5717611.1 hypothetical protein [Stakelama sediminis]